MSRNTATGALQPLRWCFTWGILYLAAQTLGVVVNVAALAVDFLGVATEAHADTSSRNLIENYLVAEIRFVDIFLTAPLVLALIVLWALGPRLRSSQFRVLSFVMFLWFAPLMVLFFGTEFLLQIWFIVSLVFASAIRLPQDRTRSQAPG